MRTDPPEAIVDESGRVRFGVHDSPPARANLEAARLTMGPFTLPAWLARLRLKQWQHVAVVTPDAFVGLAVVDAGFIRTTWCHVVDRRTGAHFEHARQGPRLDLRVPPDIWDDRCHVRAPGYVVVIDNRLAAGEHRIGVDIAAAGDLPSVAVALRCPHDLGHIRALAVVLPVGDNRGMYSLKVPLPAQGTLRIGDSDIVVDPATSFAIWDVHKAHYPRRTFWNWATFAGRDAQGRALALNLTRNVNLDDARLNENALWVDGALEHLGPARFQFDPKHTERPWRLSTSDGAVDLEFRPEGDRHQSLRLGVVETVFRQPYGTFTGEVVFRGERLPVDGLFGVCEDHVSVW